MLRPGGIELWGGIEATRNRVGDRYFDQLDRSGHAVRIDDLDRVAKLGIRTLRYPMLWERIAPDGIDKANWTWADERMQRLRALGINPIVTLVHHGSGPAHVDLLSPRFATELAQFAGVFAARYPWVTDFTPVNEPLTTARFSALYGHWHPHLRDMRAMIEALLTQVRATCQAMDAIRAVNSDARLIQTEDIGRTFSTPALTDQARFDNERRWLSLDLLCGRVRPDHGLWGFLMRLGINAEWFEDLSARPCPPDLIGLNYYVTGERFLDERTERYPAHTHGGNGRLRYADIEAVRVRRAGLFGLTRVLLETWKRFHLPIAVTESHLGADVDDQIRWLEEGWQAVHTARLRGVDIRALTVWSLFGAFNWDSLVTRDDNRYEPGAFDVSGAEPRETEITGWIRARASGRAYDGSALTTRGWWRRPVRLLYSTDLPGAHKVVSSPQSLLAGGRNTEGRMNGADHGGGG